MISLPILHPPPPHPPPETQLQPLQPLPTPSPSHSGHASLSSSVSEGRDRRSNNRTIYGVSCPPPLLLRMCEGARLAVSYAEQEGHTEGPIKGSVCHQNRLLITNYCSASHALPVGKDETISFSGEKVSHLAVSSHTMIGNLRNNRPRMVASSSKESSYFLQHPRLTRRLTPPPPPA